MHVCVVGLLCSHEPQLLLKPRCIIYKLNRKLSKKERKELLDKAPKLVKKSNKNGRTYV